MVARAVGAALAGATLLLAAAVCLFASGPVSLTFLSPYVQDALAGNTPGYKWEIQQTILDWTELRRALSISISGVRLIDASGAVVAQVPHANIGLSAPALLSGTLAPASIELEGPSVTLLRLEDGRFRLGIAVLPDTVEQKAGPNFSEMTARVFALLMQPPGQDGRAGAFTHFAARNVAMVYRDFRLGTTWEASGAEFTFDRAEQGIKGEAALAVKIADQIWSLAVTGRLVQATKEVQLDIAFAGVEPFRIAAEAELLAPLAQLRLPLSGTVGLVLGADGQVQRVKADINAGPGEIDLPDFMPEAVKLDSLEIAGEYELAANLVRLDSARFRQGALQITAAGSVEYGVDSPAIQIRGDLVNAQVEAIKRLWPLGVAKGSRGWFVNNMDSGEIGQAHFEIDVPRGVIGFGPIPDAAYKAEMQFNNVSGHYLRPMPPIENGRGSAVLTGRRFALELDEGTVLGDLRLSEGKFVLENTHLPDKDSQISLQLNGSVTRTLQLIDYPPLGYPSKFGIDPKAIGGEAATRIELQVPIKDKTKTSDIRFATASNIHGLLFPGVLNGIDLQQGELLVKVNGKGLQADGSARFLDVPAELSWTETFNAGKGPSSNYTAKAVADEKQLEALGFPTAGLISGPTKLSVEMWGRGSKIAGGKVLADLQDAELIAKPLSWRKPKDKAALAAFDFVLPEGEGARFENLRLTGDAIDVSGRIIFEVKGPPKFVNLSELRLGPNNQLRGEAQLLPGGAYAVKATGARADISETMKGISSSGGVTGEQSSGLAFELDARVDKVILREGSALNDVVAKGSFDGDDFKHLSVDGNFGPGGGVVLRLGPGATGNRVLSVESQDAGKILYGMDLFDSGIGGQFRLNAEFLDQEPRLPNHEPPMRGEIKALKLQVVNAPVLARILTVASLTGIVDLLGGGGITFERVHVPFSSRDGVMTVKEAYASGSELGITLDGTKREADGTVDMQGTVIPAHTLNTVFGKVPLLGKMLLGGKNEGIFAISYYASGPGDDPKISVNPLSALTPGFLRRIFDLGDLAAPPQAAPAAPSGQ